MKHISLLAVFCCIIALTACDKQKLPYDLEGVERGVIINITKVAGTSTTLSTDVNAGDYQVELSVPDYYQGDMSMFKEAQLMAVYTDTEGNKTPAYVVEGITEFPAKLKLNIKDVISKCGKSAIEIGDRIEFTPCYTLKSGTQVDGWSELMGFNNVRFTWTLDDGSNYQYRVSYTAFAPFHKDHFQGTAQFALASGEEGEALVKQITELPDDKWIPKGVTANDLVGLQVDLTSYDWFGDMTFKMWINTQDFTIIMPDQVTCFFSYGAYGAYDVNLKNCEGEVDTLNDSLWFYWYTVWGPYSFGDEIVYLFFK
ncbi:MAG: hypothetical protein J5801_06230 [Bacteroidales bacterium]|nr:hypothetical protein [Bacteroidales bacterium]